MNSILNQIINSDGGNDKYSTIKPNVLKAMIYQSNRNPKEVMDFLDQVLTEAKQALDQEKISQMLFVDLLSELQNTLNNYYSTKYQQFSYRLKHRSQAEKIFWDKICLKINEFFDFESNGQLVDALNEATKFVEQGHPELLMEWKELAICFSAGYELIFKIIANILYSTKVNNKFDEKKLSQFLNPIIYYNMWGLIKVLLDMEGKNLPLDIEKDTLTLPQYASHNHSKMGRVVTKYLILLGCTFPIPHINGYVSQLDLRPLQWNLANVYDAVMSPATSISFFRNLPDEVKLVIALHTLRAQDPDLSYIPDKILESSIYRKDLHLHQSDDEMLRYREIAVLLAVRKFREYYQQPMGDKVTLDKRALLRQINDEKVPNLGFSAGERKLFVNTFKRAASVGLYMSIPEVNVTVDTFLLDLMRISSLLDDACVLCYLQNHKSINYIEKDDLLDKLILAIANHEDEIKWNPENSSRCATMLADLIKTTAEKPDPKSTPGLFQNSSFMRKISTEDVERLIQRFIENDKSYRQNDEMVISR